MIINEKDAQSRLNSPGNLMNKLKSLSTTGAKRQNAMGLFGIGKEKKAEEKTSETAFNPFNDKEVKTESSASVSLALPASLPKPTPTNVDMTTLDNILEDNEAQINLGLAHDNALKLLNNSVAMMATKLDDVRADRLPGVIASASKVVESIRKERSEAHKSGKDKEIHYHFYTPEQRKVSEYEVIDVVSSPAS